MSSQSEPVSPLSPLGGSSSTLCNPKGLSTDDLAQQGKFVDVENDLRKAGDRHRQSTAVKSWFFELVAITLAVALLVASFVTLHIFNGQQTSTWKAPINLSSLIATFSTISRIALATIVSEIISQHKWSWLTTPSPLRHFEVFDKASRGPWGLVLLLSKMGSRGFRSPFLLITLGVALTSIAMGPFAQQAVAIIPCEYTDPRERASIPNVQTLGNIPLNETHSANLLAIINNPNKTNLPGPSYSAGIEFNAAAQVALISSLMEPAAKDSIISVSCPNGNCDFPRLYEDTDGTEFTYRSPGFCSRCHDISSSMRYHSSRTVTKKPDSFVIADDSWRRAIVGRAPSPLLPPPGLPDIVDLGQTWTLPEGLSIRYDITYRSDGEGRPYTYTRDTPFLNVSSSILGSNDEPDLDGPYFPLMNISFLSIDSLTAEPPKIENNPGYIRANVSVSATSCELYPCLKTYLATVLGERLNETVVSSEPLAPYGKLKSLDDIKTRLYRCGSAVKNAKIVHPVFPSDLISVRTPCIVDGQVYTSHNLSSAPGAVTISRLTGIEPRTGNETGDTFCSRVRHDRLVVKNITAPPACLYAMSLDDAWYPQMQRALLYIMRGSCWSSLDDYSAVYLTKQLCRGSAGKRFSALESASTEFVPNPFWLEGIARLSRRSQPELSAYMESFAESVTRKIRLGTFSTPGRDQPGNEWRAKPEVVLGDIRRTTTCFAVDWRWLMLPTTLTVLTAVVLAWSVLRGLMRGDVIWKSSILPLFYYRDRIVVVDRVGEEDERLWGPEKQLLVGVEAMKADSKHVEVVFRDR